VTGSSFPPARSALNLRLLLAAFGLAVSVFLGVLVLRALGLVPALALFAVAFAALVDLAVVVRRRRERAAAHRGAGHQHDSLFE
jgi:hypothetical protein